MTNFEKIGHQLFPANDPLANGDCAWYEFRINGRYIRKESFLKILKMYRSLKIVVDSPDICDILDQ